jgi:hypothetical protein
MEIYPQDIAPQIAPERPYRAPLDTVIIRYNTEQSIVQEIFKRKTGTFGLRYQAWVNFPDAGDIPHHTWYAFPPKSHVVTDTTESAKHLAEFHAKKSGISFGGWITTQPVISSRDYSGKKRL